MAPNFGLPFESSPAFALVFGTPNTTLLKRLNASARNSKYLSSPSPIGNLRNTDMSTLFQCCETIEFTFSLPYVYAAGIEKALVLNHCARVLGPLFGFPLTWARCWAQQLIFSASVPVCTVKGRPEVTCTMPLTAHPPAT